MEKQDRPLTIFWDEAVLKKRKRFPGKSRRKKKDRDNGGN